jgi:hypothetical protein
MALTHDKRGDKDRKFHIAEIEQRLAEMSGGRRVSCTRSQSRIGPFSLFPDLEVQSQLLSAEQLAPVDE